MADLLEPARIGGAGAPGECDEPAADYPPRSPRPFPWVPLFALLAVVLVVVAAVAEAVLRLPDLRCGPNGLHGQKGLYQLDDAAGYVMRPNQCVLLNSAEYQGTLRTNNHGLVGPPLPDAKPAGEFRVVVLGDSYTAGGQVPYAQNFTAVLEAQLRAAGHPNVRVVDAGTGGWTTFNQAGFLRANLAWLQPDLVVVAAFVGNDIAENVLATRAGYLDVPEHPDGITYGPAAADLLQQSVAWFPRNGVPPQDMPPPYASGQPLPEPLGNAGALAERQAQPPTPPAGRPSLRQLVPDFWNGVRLRSRVLAGLFGAPIDPSVSTAPGAAPPSVEQKKLNAATFEWTVLRDPPRTYWLDVAYPLFERYLGRLRDTAATAGAPTVMMVIPEMAQFDDARQARVTADYRFNPDEVDWDRPQRELSAVAAHVGVPVLDLLPGFRARADRDRLYLRLDTHFDALGHQAAGEVLADFLLTRGFVR